jgi:hypothetical protein
MRGAGLEAVQELLGHASRAVTVGYAHLADGDLKDPVSLLNNLPNGRELENITPKDKKVSNLEIANLL